MHSDWQGIGLSLSDMARQATRSAFACKYMIPNQVFIPWCCVKSKRNILSDFLEWSIIKEIK